MNDFIAVKNGMKVVLVGTKMDEKNGRDHIPVEEVLLCYSQIL